MAWPGPIPGKTTLSDPDGSPWHIDVEWIPSRNEFWAVYPVKQSGSCTTDRLRFATSADGVHWTSYPSPLLARGASDGLRDVVYRSTIDFDAATGVVSVWYSGAKYENGGYSWHLAWERMQSDALSRARRRTDERGRAQRDHPIRQAAGAHERDRAVTRQSQPESSSAHHAGGVAGRAESVIVPSM